MQAITVESLPEPLSKHLHAIIRTRHATATHPFAIVAHSPQYSGDIVPWLVPSSLGLFVPVNAL